MATAFTLRAIKCPGCGARVPCGGGETSVTCEYCGTTSRVLTERPAPREQARPASPSPSQPVATAQVRPGVIVAFAVVPLVASGAMAAFISNVPRPEAAAPAPVIAAAPEGPSSPLTEEPPPRKKKKRRKGAQNGPSAAVPEDEATPKPEPGSREAKIAPLPRLSKPKPKPKPKPYEIARIIKPSFQSCAPDDILAPGHPLWYTPTITLTVRDGGFEDVGVRVKLSNTDPAELRFRESDKGEVTQSELDRRRKDMSACVTRSVTSTKIPAGHAQQGTEGKIQVTFTRDGVPYGVKNL